MLNLLGLLKTMLYIFLIEYFPTTKVVLNDQTVDAAC